MKKIDVALIGINGFLARHCIEVFKQNGLNWVGFGRTKPKQLDAENFVQLDLQNRELPLAAATKMHAETLIFNSAVKGRYQPGSDLYQMQGLVSAPDFQKLSKDLNLTFSRLITIGSSEEYGLTTGDAAISEAAPLSPISSYGFWKKRLYQNGLKWSAENNSEFIHLRPFNIFGPGCDPTMFLRQLIETLLSNQSFKMTLGEQHRSFASVETVKKTIAALLVLVSWKDVGLSHAINISEPNYFKMRDVAELVSSLIGRGQVEFGALPYRSEEVWHQRPDLSHLQKLLGKNFSTDFKTEIKKLIETCEDSKNDFS